MNNVYTFTIKVTTKGNVKKNSLNRRIRKVQNLKKIDSLMFKLVKNSPNLKNMQIKSIQL